MEEHDRYEVLKEICAARKSTRSFSDRIPPREVIDKIKEIGFTAPYASGKKNWDILVVEDRALIDRIAEAAEKKIKGLGERIRPDFRRAFLEYAKSFTAFRTAPIIFVLIFRIAGTLSLIIDEPSREVLDWERDTCTKSISCPAMLILLAAESLGLGACYMTGALIAEREIGGLIKIGRGRSIGAIIPVGYKRGEND
jgi:nitroreductase